ncbi:MAG: hypothetical protein KA004_11200 [Verrucomicrobiales bacterium]|nr:hypothetical protein [Verrucomicrobiales bacterium]
MNRLFLFSGISFLIGAALGAFLISRQNAAEQERWQAKVSQLEEKLAGSPASAGKHLAVKAARPDHSETKSAEGASSPKMAVFGATTPGPEAMKLAEEWRQKMRKSREEKNKLKVDERLAALRGRLHLTAEQAEALKPLLARMLSRAGGIDLLNDNLSGDPKVDWSMDAIKQRQEKAREDREAAEQEMLTSLTPEQRQAYEQWKEEERANRLEMRANQDLTALQSQFTLTAEQKDKAFAAFSKLAADEGETPAVPFGDPAAFTKRREQRIDAMKDILTPEQLAVYQRNAGGPIVNIGFDGMDDFFMDGDLIPGSAAVIAEPGSANTPPLPPSPPPAELTGE